MKLIYKITLETLRKHLIIACLLDRVDRYAIIVIAAALEGLLSHRDV